ncbi:MAG: GDYXXLXY domain-containing protein [Chromatiales bacterium]
MRNALLAIATLLVLGVVTGAIVQKEKLLKDGRVILLELAPVDPRSLMQGDYMALRFEIATRIPTGEKTARDGYVIVTVDERAVGAFGRLDDGTPLAPREARMRYRIRNDEVKFATNAFFFQEGHAEVYAPARFGEFRVSESGDMLLTGLRDEDLQPLAPPAAP